MGSTLAIMHFSSGTKLQLILQHYEPVFFKCFATCMTHPLIKVKHSVLLAKNNDIYNAFAAILTANTALP